MQGPRFSLSESARIALVLLLACASCTDSDAEPEDSGSDSAEASEPDAATSSSERDAGAAATTDAAARDAESARDARSASPEGVDARAETASDASRTERDAASEAGAAVSEAGASDPKSIASALDGLFIDVPCATNTPTPLAQGATCQHPGTTQHIDKKLRIAGTPGTTYEIKLRVRGIWEPTFIQGGMRPYGKMVPFTSGGTVATGAGDPINYQQYLIQVSEPKQTYWLNDYQYVAHDIHKEDYQATIRVAASADVTVSMNDGNDHAIANWTRDFFSGLAPYDKAPSTGQMLRLDVVSITPL